MSGDEPHQILGGILMCNCGNNNFFGGNMCWIIILLILFCGCGNNGAYGYGNNHYDCDSNRCC
jgi:hypothetical protein